MSLSRFIYLKYECEPTEKQLEALVGNLLRGVGWRIDPRRNTPIIGLASAIWHVRGAPRHELLGVPGFEDYPPELLAQAQKKRWIEVTLRPWRNPDSASVVVTTRRQDTLTNTLADMIADAVARIWGPARVLRG